MVASIAALNQPRVRFAYVDDTIVDCRVRAMYKMIMRNDYEKVAFNAKDTLLVLKTATELDMNPKLFSKIVDNLYRVRIDYAKGDYKKMHDRVREMHYAILSGYLD